MFMGKIHKKMFRTKILYERHVSELQWNCSGEANLRHQAYYSYY